MKKELMKKEIRYIHSIYHVYLKDKKTEKDRCTKHLFFIKKKMDT